MMEAKTYNLCLIGNDVRDEFLKEIKDKYNILSVPKNIPSIMTVSLTESEREELLKHIYVIEIEEERPSYPASTVVYTPIQFTDKIATVQEPDSLQEPGSNYVSAIHKYMTNGTGITGTLGLKGDDSAEISGTSYRSFLSGEHVDIVTLEARGNTQERNFHNTHPEWNAIGELRSDGTITPGTNDSRCVPMNWQSYNSDVDNSLNTDQSSTMLSHHAAGVLSCAGGQVGGLAKNASLRVIYTVDGINQACDAIISWHNSKSTNTITGQKNPTIVVGEWQYLVGNSSAVQIRDIASFVYRGTTTTRPDSSRNPDLNGWLLSDFVEKNMLPKLVPTRVTDNNNYSWCITFDGFGPSLADKNALQSLIDNGIHFICAAGNDCGTHSKFDDEDYDNKITTDSGTYKFFREFNTRPSGAGYKPENRTGPEDYFYYRSIGPAGVVPDQINVGAYQRSEVTPAVDGYTVRGPVIDIFGLGGGTWSAKPQAEYGDGYKYGMFGGTSAASPTVVGVAACMLEYSFLTTGSYPTPASLKTALLDGSIDRVKNYETIDWDDPAFSVRNLNSSFNASAMVDDYRRALEVPDNRNAQNGNIVATDLVGSTTRAAFLPDFMRNYFPPSQGGSGNVVPDPVPPASVPGACIPPTIKGPTNLQPSPPYDYAKSFDKHESGRGNSPHGIYFLPKGEESNYPPDNISYVNFRLRFRGFGPRGGRYPYENDTLYLTSNRGNRDPNKGNVRRWYTTDQSLADRDDKYTTNKNEAFVPFKINFRLGFICGGDGDYRILYYDKEEYWSNFEYKDIDFESSELASRNSLPTDGSGKLIFPDFGSKTYTNPRIFQIKADIYNLDLNANESERKNRINMFAVATDDENKAKESNVLEFGKFIIT